MNLVTDDVHRALLYVLVLNENGAYPTKQNLNDFVQTKLPKSSSSATILSASLSRMVGEIMSPKWQKGDEVADYMIAMGWLLEGKNNGLLLLTNLGRAMSVGLEKEESTDEAGATIYSSTPDNPIALSQLASLLNRSDSQMYIDPHLGADQVQWLANNTPVRRMVTRERFGPEISARLAEVNLPDDLEVRVLTGKTLHDRGAVHANNGVAIIGSSINGMQGKYVAMVDLPANVSGSYLNVLEDIWSRATPLTPTNPNIGDKKPISESES
jgi:hypothetical protein